jgi:flavocytochrome c
MEKEHFVGGNSNKASSGINACCFNQQDTLELFRNDTTKSAGDRAQPQLIHTLTENSAAAVQWLRERCRVDLSVLAQLGGHSVPRTHRPAQGMVGAEIIAQLRHQLQPFEKTGQLQIYTDTLVTELIHTGNENDNQPIVLVNGVMYKAHDGAVRKLYSSHVVLATGGFAADRSAQSLLSQHRPELVPFATTAGPWSTGDGILLGQSMGAAVIDMEYVQLHPTGFVDPANPNDSSKVLAAEVTRGVGGILLNHQGQRFANELGLRSYVTDQMLRHDAHYRATGRWNVETAAVPTFALVLGSAAAASARKHVDFYTSKGLLTRLEGGVEALAKWLPGSPETLVQTLQEYQKASDLGRDEFGKTFFPGVPRINDRNETFYVGRVTPVLHFTMGGLQIDAQGHVLTVRDEQVMTGLWAVGEVSGGVHGVNRLGGNSLLECAVFGRIVGQAIPVAAANYESVKVSESSTIKSEANQKKKPKPALRTISRGELAKHSTPEDCWVAVHGTVYDLTQFANEHPAGKAPIHMHAGKDATETFDILHNKRLLQQYADVLVVVGKLGK